MTLYEKIDLIADGYIPILISYAFFSIYESFKINNKILVCNKIFRLFLLIVVVYIIQFVDSYYLLWNLYALDYSTHTAFSLAMVFFFLPASAKIKIIIIISFIAYLLLMLYQEYHTVADVLTTMAVLLPIMYLINAYFDQKNCKNK